MIAFALALVVQAAPFDCTDRDHRAFDFWLGEWTVSAAASDTVVGQSRIEVDTGGCAIREIFHQTIGPGGVATEYRGNSYNAFDARSRTWRQFYIDSTGNVARYEGGIENGAMVMTTPGDVRQRMTVRAESADIVRQTGEVSTDGGQTWSTGYELVYRRR